MHLRVGVIEDPPFTFNACGAKVLAAGSWTSEERNRCNAIQESTSLSPLLWKGVTIDIIKLIAKHANFTYEWVRADDHSHGHRLNPLSANASIAERVRQWSGVLGLLGNNRVDIAGGLMTMTRERLQDFDFVTLGSVTDEVVISNTYLHNKTLSSFRPTGTNVLTKWLNFCFILSPFTPLAWLLISGSSILCLLILMLVESLAEHCGATPKVKTSPSQRKTVKRRDRNSNLRLFSEPNVQRGREFKGKWGALFMEICVTGENVVGLLAARGAELMPSTWPARIVLLTWALTCTLLTSLYGAQLASQALAPASRVPFESFATMHSAGYRLVTLKDGITIENLKEIHAKAEKSGNQAEVDAINEIQQDLFSRGWPSSTPHMNEALTTNKLQSEITPDNELVKISEGPFAVLYAREWFRGLYQTGSCGLLPVKMLFTAQSCRTGFPFLRQEPHMDHIRQMFEKAVYELRDLGLLQQVMEQRRQYWIFKTLNGSFALNSMCGETVSKRNTEFNSGADLRQPADNKFDKVSLFSLRAAFSLMAVGALTAGILMLLEAALSRMK